MDIIALYLLIGTAAGLSAGLFGIGGGLLMVPALTHLFSYHPSISIDDSIIPHTAIATSLAVIIITGLVSAYSHYRIGHVRWPWVWRLAPGLALGAIIGAWIADELPAATLKFIFGSFEIAIALYLLFNHRPRQSQQNISSWVVRFAGVFIGMLSAIMGIAGGTLLVPLLIWYGLRIHEAVAISATTAIAISLTGTLGFISVGLDATTTDQSWGYVYLPALVSIALTSVIFAPVGAMIAHRLASDKLKRAFALTMLLLGASMYL